MKKSLLLLLVCLSLCMSLIFAACSSGGSDPAGSDDTTVNDDKGNGEGEHTCSMVEVSRIDATFTAAGSITYKCSCGEERIKPIAKLEHKIGRAHV